MASGIVRSGFAEVISAKEFALDGVCFFGRPTHPFPFACLFLSLFFTLQSLDFLPIAVGNFNIKVTENVAYST